MERMWTGDAMMKYPKQWVVLVNIIRDKQTHKAIGDVYLVTPDKKEAYAKAMALGDTLGISSVVEGFDDTRRIGGFPLWNR